MVPLAALRRDLLAWGIRFFFFFFFFVGRFWKVGKLSQEGLKRMHEGILGILFCFGGAVVSLCVFCFVVGYADTESCPEEV